MSDIQSSPYYFAALRTFVSLKNNPDLDTANDRVAVKHLLNATEKSPEKRQALLNVFTSQFVEGADPQVKQRYGHYINHAGRSQNLRNPVLQENIQQITAGEEKTSLLPLRVGMLSFAAYQRGKAYGAVNKNVQQFKNAVLA
ncbi:MAG TPA: hypothetical protein VGF14_04355 [Alphaproteobacteria bacterium]